VKRGVFMFALGLFAGAVFALAMVGGLLGRVSREGVQVTIDRAALAPVVAEEIVAASISQRDVLAAACRSEVPGIVAAGVDEAAGIITKELGSGAAALARGQLERMSGRLEQRIAQRIDRTIHELDPGPTSGEMVEAIVARLMDRLAGELGGDGFCIEVLPRLKVPLHLRLSAP